MAAKPSERTSVAQWLVDGLLPFDRYVAGSVVPPGFEAYARVLHPAFGKGPEADVRWSEVAAWSGRVHHPTMQFEAIATPAPGGGTGPKPWRGDTPWDLPPSQGRLLARILEHFTTTPGDIWYCVWEGHADMADIAAVNSARVRRRHRAYLLYNGPLAAVSDIRLRSSWHPECFPEYWFPADRAWCVASDVDLFWTYVGGTRACTGAIMAEGGLEAVPASLDDGLTPDSDLVNRDP